MKKSYLFLLTLSLMTKTNLFAQGSTICKYVCNYNNTDYGRSVITTADGGVAVLGTMHDAAPSTERDMYFVRFNATLSAPPPAAAKKIGDVSGITLRKEEGYSIMQASDGFYYAIGTTEGSTKDVYIAKLDPVTFNIVWAKNYGKSNYHETGIKILEVPSATAQPRLLVIGYRQSSLAGSNPQHDIFAFKIDAAGNYDVATGTHIYGGGNLGLNDDYARDAIKLSSLPGKYVIVGETNNGTNQNALAFRIDGNTLAMSPNDYYTIDDRKESGRAIEEISGKLYIAGKSNIDSASQGDDVLLTVLPPGFIYSSLNTTRIYGKAFDPMAWECGYSMVKINDTSLVIAGYKSEAISGTRKDGLVLKIKTSDLGIVWSKRLGTSSNPNPYLYDDEFYDITKLPNNQLAITGYTGLTSTDNELFVSLMNADGSGCCYLNYPMNSKIGGHPGPKFIELTKDTVKTGAYKFDVQYYCEKNLCSEIHGDPGSKQPITFIKSSPGTNSGQLVIYPNPNNGSFSIQLPDSNEQIQTVSVLDVSGKVLYSEQLKATNENNTADVFVPGLAKGMYLVEVKTMAHKFTAKMVVQ